MQVGDHVVYNDAADADHHALVLAVFPQVGQEPLVNLAFVQDGQIQEVGSVPPRSQLIEPVEERFRGAYQTVLKRKPGPFWRL